MCGIYGSTIYYPDEIIKAKLAVINFRGPDHSGFEHLGRVILGHNRLAIIDLDHRSDQPFFYEHLSIVFNGEIYNYQEIKKKLATKGYAFTTDSDTEVIAAAYLEYGENCVDQFNGMFAFVIYDSTKQQFYGARDRLGKKPFYYARNGTDFEFASQPSQIGIGRQLSCNEKAINEFFIWGYIPEPASAWNGIEKLEAGHFFVFNLESGNYRSKKYWDLDVACAGRYEGSYREATIELNSLITSAVDIRMNADVDLGVFLSGGIDSSIVAAIAARNGQRVKTFCVKFGEKAFDESLYANNIAVHLGTDHQTIECSANEGIKMIEKFADFYDEPFADPSAIPTMLLSKYTKEFVTVALSGDGGDENFMGYTRYKWFKIIDRFFKYPLTLRRAVAAIVSLSPDYRHKLIALGIANPKISSLYGLMMGGLEYSWLKQPDIGLDIAFMDIWYFPSLSLLQKMSLFDIKTYLNGDINTKVDRASMAFAIEARAPLMDHRIVTFAHSLPDHFKYGSNMQKRILKDVLFQYVPARMFERPKSGFSVPLRHWFRNELKDYVMDELSLNELKNIPGVDVLKARLMIDQHMNGKWNRSQQIWKLLVFTQWLKKQRAGSTMNLQTA